MRAAKARQVDGTAPEASTARDPGGPAKIPEGWPAWVLILVRAPRHPVDVGRQVFLLAEGAMAAAGILGDPGQAAVARAAATLLTATSAR